MSVIILIVKDPEFGPIIWVNSANVSDCIMQSVSLTVIIAVYLLFVPNFFCFMASKGMQLQNLKG